MSNSEPAEQSVICPYCGKPAQWVDNTEIYGKRYGSSYMAWWCEPCDAYVGCHKNTKRPLGTMADKDTRGARMKAHGAFDPIWKSGRLSRSEAYGWLNQQLGREVHIGEATVAQCSEIVTVCRNFNRTKPEGSGQ